MVKLNDSKSVGSVIYVVEGDRDEVNILNIFIIYMIEIENQIDQVR